MKGREQRSIDSRSERELLVGQILEAETLESPREHSLLVDLGTRGEARILGAFGSQNPQSLIGRKIVVELFSKNHSSDAPAYLGRALCARDEFGNIEIINPGSAIAPGSQVG